MTNNQRATLKMSLIPLVILIGLILGAGYFLLQGEIKLPKFNKGPQLRRLEGFPTVIYTDATLEKQRKILKSEQELAEFLNYMDPSGLTEVRSPINFDREYLIAVSSDTQDETGHTIKVKKIYQDKEDKTLLVTLEETEEAENCELENDKNVMADVVAISKTDWKVEFERVKKIIDCKSEEDTDAIETEQSTDSVENENQE